KGRCIHAHNYIIIRERGGGGKRERERERGREGGEMGEGEGERASQPAMEQRACLVHVIHITLFPSLMQSYSTEAPD
ncbi:MAG: hypothetical protein MJE68_06395, partial [Proteobacteria bacterium]|nr:hypothetical protein [Pseudomonadota bacterium]